jgi:hypothetical protein
MLPNNRMFLENSDDHQIHARGYEYNRQEVQQQQQMQQVFSAASYAAEHSMEAEAAFYYEATSQQQHSDDLTAAEETEAKYYNEKEFKLTHRLTSDAHSYIEKLSAEAAASSAAESSGILSENIEITDSSSKHDPARITEISVRHIRPSMPPAPPAYLSESDSTETSIDIEIEDDPKNKETNEAETSQADAAITLPVTRVSAPAPPKQRSAEPKEVPISILIERSWPPKKLEKPDNRQYYVRYYDEEMGQSYDLLRQYVYLGVVDADPAEYYAKYGAELRQSEEFAAYTNEMKSRPECLMFADDCDCAEDYYTRPHELIGDVEALKLIDLDAHGLFMYKSLVESLTGGSGGGRGGGGGGSSSSANFENSESMQTSTAFFEERKREEELLQTTESNTSFNRNSNLNNGSQGEPMTKSSTTTTTFFEEQQKEELRQEEKTEEMVVDAASGTRTSTSSLFSASAKSEASRAVLSTVIEE